MPEIKITGSLKVMASLCHWLREFRQYHRDDKGSGKIVKRADHLMDATRYLIVTGAQPRVCDLDLSGDGQRILAAIPAELRASCSRQVTSPRRR